MADVLTVVIEVKGGVASVAQLPSGVSVLIKDYDADEEACSFPGDDGTPQEVWRIPIVR